MHCKFGNDCRRPNCTFQHGNSTPPETAECLMGSPCSRRVCHFVHATTLCKFGNGCTRPDCVFRHGTPGEATPCHNGARCGRKECHFLHKETVILCKFGNDCTRVDCRFRHGEEGTTTACRNKAACTRKECCFVHAPKVIPASCPCKFDNQCTRVDCVFVHGVEGTQEPCSFGPKCSRPRCLFKHISKWSLDSFPLSIQAMYNEAVAQLNDTTPPVSTWEVKPVTVTGVNVTYSMSERTAFEKIRFVMDALRLPLQTGVRQASLLALVRELDLLGPTGCGPLQLNELASVDGLTPEEGFRIARGRLCSYALENEAGQVNLEVVVLRWVQLVNQATLPGSLRVPLKRVAAAFVFLDVSHAMKLLMDLPADLQPAPLNNESFAKKVKELYACLPGAGRPGFVLQPEHPPTYFAILYRNQIAHNQYLCKASSKLFSHPAYAECLDVMVQQYFGPFLMMMNVVDRVDDVPVTASLTVAMKRSNNEVALLALDLLLPIVQTFYGILTGKAHESTDILRVMKDVKKIIFQSRKKRTRGDTSAVTVAKWFGSPMFTIEGSGDPQVFETMCDAYATDTEARLRKALAELDLSWTVFTTKILCEPKLELPRELTFACVAPTEGTDTSSSSVDRIISLLQSLKSVQNALDVLGRAILMLQTQHERPRSVCKFGDACTSTVLLHRMTYEHEDDREPSCQNRGHRHDVLYDDVCCRKSNDLRSPIVHHVLSHFFPMKLVLPPREERPRREDEDSDDDDDADSENQFQDHDDDFEEEEVLTRSDSTPLTDDTVFGIGNFLNAGGHYTPNFKFLTILERGYTRQFSLLKLISFLGDRVRTLLAHNAATSESASTLFTSGVYTKVTLGGCCALAQGMLLHILSLRDSGDVRWLISDSLVRQMKPLFDLKRCVIE